MKKLIRWLNNFWEALRQARKLQVSWEQNGELSALYRKEYDARALAEKQRDEFERELRLMQMEPNRAAELIMQLRVHAMFEHAQKGYGVTAFIPEAVLEKLRGGPEEQTKLFAETIADNLVYRAIKGLWYRTSMNNVSALVFDWRPEHRGEVNAVCMQKDAPMIAARNPATKKIEAVTLPTALPEKSIWS